MASKFLIGIDFGGGGGRCLVVEVASRAMTVAFRTWAAESHSDLPTASDVDAERCWEQLCECVREALQRAGAEPGQVAGIAATSMRHASALLDTDGELLLATSNQDARGLVEALRIGAESGDELHRRTGHWPNPIQAAGRLLWLKQQPDAGWERAATHLSLGDWLGFRLCGEVATDPSQASETLLFDLAEGDWAWDLIDRFELPRGLFPEVRAPGSRLGGLSSDAAAELGLPAGIPVAVAGGDTQCGLLGAGVTQPYQVGVILGTTAPIQFVVDRPLLDESARLWSAHHVIPGQWVVESNGGGGGSAAEWLAGLLFPDTPWPLGHLFAEAECSIPGAAGMTSTLGADVMDARKLGLPIGNLTLSPMGAGNSRERRQHLARSVVEGFAFGLRANIEQAEAVVGRSATRIHVAGGLTRNAFFTRMLADVLDRPVAVSSTPDATALGAAICAGAASGVFPDLAAGAEALSACDRTCEPGSDAKRYAQLYEDWNGLRLARAESDAAAAALAVKGLLWAPRPAASAVASNGARPRILVTAEMDDEGLAGLQRIGDVEHVPFKQAMRLLTGRTLAEALAGVEVFVTEVDVVDAIALSEADDLRVVATCRGDAVNVDVAACSDLGIPVLNAPGRNADAVADLTLTYLLMLARRMPEAAAFLREPGGEAGDMGRMGRAFKHLQGQELWNKTVGLVGMGAVGRKVIERLLPFGVHCLVHDPYVEADRIRLAGAEPASLSELLEQSDFVSLHAAVSDETTGMIGAAEIARMRPGTSLVNTARAALVDQDALVDALASGHLGGAALDVFAVEPPASDDPLLALDNVIATPHIGGNTAEVASHQGRIIAADLERMRSGLAPLYALNPEVLADFDWTRTRTPPTPEQTERLRQRPPPAVTDLERQSPAKPVRRAAATGAPNVGAGEPGILDPEIGRLRDSMERVLAAFARGLVDDEALRDTGAGRDVVLHFTIVDLDLEFHFGFARGDLIGGIGAPDDAADVQLKLRAELFDGMFTGRTNAMQAAMEGEISFSGDTAKAMTLTEIQADMERVYRNVIAEVGQPGDLSSIPRPGESVAETADPGIPTRASEASKHDVRHQLVEVVNELYATQLITATGGNVSVRSETPGEIWITPSQLFKGDLTPEILVRIGMDGRALDPAARSPSSEALIHTAVFAAKPEARAVIHCHAPNATILVNSGLPFLPISTEAAFLVGIGRIPFVMPGTAELATAVVEAMGDGWAVLMQNHGVLVAGRSLRRAADMAEIIERTAEVILGCFAVGREPPVLPEETVALLSRMGDLMA